MVRCLNFYFDFNNKYLDVHACSMSVFLSITPTRRVAGRLRSTVLGFATAELLLPKRIFSVSLKWGF